MQREAGGKKTDECGGSSKIKQSLYKSMCEAIAKRLDKTERVQKAMFPRCEKKGVILRDEDEDQGFAKDKIRKMKIKTRDTKDKVVNFFKRESDQNLDRNRNVGVSFSDADDDMDDGDEDMDDGDEDELSRSLGKFAAVFPSHQYTALQSKATLALTSA